MRTSPLIASSLAVGLCAGAGADGLATMNVNSGSTAVVTITVTVTTALGTSSSTDTKTMGNSGYVTAQVGPLPPPFNCMTMLSSHSVFSTTTFNFQFYCVPFIGCQNVNLTLTNLTFDLVSPVAAPVNPAGQVTFTNATTHVTGSYTTTGAAPGSGTIDMTSMGSLSGRITAASGIATFDQLAVPTTTFVADPSQLPPGLTALTVVIAANLSNTKDVGPVVPTITGDLNGDGKVNGVDLGILLGSWGTPLGDLNCDGVTNGADLGILIGGWTG